MDILWFKQQQKKAGVTSNDLGQLLQRDRTVVSKILHGKQRMSLEQAKVFATALGHPISEILTRAGITDEQTARHVQPGFSEGDVAPWAPKDPDAAGSAAAFFDADKPGIDIWQTKSRAMALQGILEGDCLLVDSNLRDRAKDGDVVLAQVYDWQTGGAATILRRYCPPVIVAASTDPGEWQAKVVDNNNVSILGVVVASWRHNR